MPTCSEIVQCPNCNRFTTGGLFGHMNNPVADGEQAWVVTHCGCYHEPHGGERFTAERDAIWLNPNDKS